MTRRLVTVASLAWLALLASLWVRSYWRVDQLDVYWRGSAVESWLICGRLMVECNNFVNPYLRADLRPGPELTIRHASNTVGPSVRQTWWWRDGIDWFPGPMDGDTANSAPAGGRRSRVLALPMSAAVPILSGPPLLLTACCSSATRAAVAARAAANAPAADTICAPRRSDARNAARRQSDP
jgi:hypothetical protein